MIAFLLAISAIVPQPLSAGNETLRVEVAECNTVVAKDNHDRVVLRQIILWRWMRLTDGCDHHVTQWYNVKQDPEPIRRDGRYKFSIVANDTTIVISARSYRMTRSNYDREVTDRHRLYESDRQPYIAARASNGQ